MLADWLGYYNDLDKVPELEALETMRVFYTGGVIDILKDADSPAPRGELALYLLKT